MAERAPSERSARIDIPRLPEGDVEGVRKAGELVVEGEEEKWEPEKGREALLRFVLGEVRAAERAGELFGSWRSSPGERGGRMGAPLAIVPCGTVGMSAVRTGGRGLSSMSSAPARASESRLAMLDGMDARMA